MKATALALVMGVVFSAPGAAVLIIDGGPVNVPPFTSEFGPISS